MTSSSHPKKKLVQRLVDHRASAWMLHDSLVVDEVVKVRAILYGSCALLLVVTSVLVSLPYFIQGQMGLGILTLSFGLLGLSSLLALRFLGNMSIVTHLICLALWGSIVSGYLVFGGVDSYNNKWLVLMPLLGAFSGDRVVGWTWMFIAICTPLGFERLIFLNVIHPVSVFDPAQLAIMDMGNSILFICIISLTIFIFHAHHGWVIDRLSVQTLTLRSNNDELIIARDEALLASRARDQFLAKMSHELRTPLTAILGYSEMIQDELHDADVRNHDADFALIQHSGALLLGMLQDILDLTKFESGQVDLLSTSVDVVALVESLVSSRSRVVSLEVHDAWRGTILDTHRDTFYRLLDKLLDNACKFARAEDRVGVVMYPPRESGYVIEVFDEGPGIAQSEHERIWEPFYQVDGSFTRTRDGTGLGLSLVRQFGMVLSMQVSLQSDAGQGTRVFITLSPDRVKPGSEVAPHPHSTT